MRVYQPTTLTELVAAYAAGSVQPDADAVVSESESEDDEYAALGQQSPASRVGVWSTG